MKRPEHSKFMKENNPAKRPEVREKLRNKKLSDQHKKIISNHQMGKGNSSWKGGTYSYWHAKAKELFGIGKCEVCGMLEEEHKRKFGVGLHMHNQTKDYKNMIKDVWKEVCISDHRQLDWRKVNDNKKRDSRPTYFRYREQT